MKKKLYDIKILLRMSEDLHKKLIVYSKENNMSVNGAIRYALVKLLK